MAVDGTPAGRRARQRNRRTWERTGGSYERQHARALTLHDGMAWGFWRRPERDLGLLGEVRGLRVLELGCGAARFALGIAHRGGRPVGIDASRTQLRAARRALGVERRDVPLVRGDAEALPFRDGSFDLVFGDFGALTFGDPERILPEAARVLRVGGRLVFSQSSPIRFLAQTRTGDRLSARFQRDYFSLGWVHAHDTDERARTYAGRVQRFRRSGFAVEGLVEPRPPARARSTYLTASEERWARRWPLESYWSLRREGPARASQDRW